MIRPFSSLFFGALLGVLLGALSAVAGADAHSPQGIATHLAVKGERPRTPPPDWDGQVEYTLGVAAKALRWPDDQPLRLCFMQVDPELNGEVAEIFQHWAAFVGLEIHRVGACRHEAAADVRVTYLSEGNWAIIGAAARQVGFPRPTVGFEALWRELSAEGELSERGRGLVTHEFFHVLGLLHEHQHPDADCLAQIDLEAFQRLYGWSRAEAEFNLRAIERYSNDAFGEITLTEYDSASLMHYALSPQVFRDGVSAECLVEERHAPSPGDLRTLRALYATP